MDYGEDREFILSVMESTRGIESRSGIQFYLFFRRVTLQVYRDCGGGGQIEHRGWVRKL